MRLRCMELPAEVVGECVRTPFVLVFDKCGDDGAEFFDGYFPVSTRDEIGAKAVLVFPGEVELGGDL